jgi:branched-chain amino acid transport system substrate-binding protein
MYRLVFVLLFALGCSRAAAPEPILLGQLLHAGGSDRSGALSARQGVELAVDDARTAEQTVAGRPVVVLHVESGDAAGIQAETVRLVAVNKVAALLAGFDPASTGQLLRANQPYGVPVVVPGEVVVTDRPSGVVSLGALPAERGRLLAHHAADALNLRRAAVLTDNRNPVAQALAAAFVKAWPQREGFRAEEWTFASKDERDELPRRVQKAAPAVVLLACSRADFRPLRSTLAGQLPRVPFLYGGPDGGVSALQGELESPPDVYLATAYHAGQLTEAGRAFARRYEERFHEPPDLYAAQSYDAARLLLETMQRAQSVSKERLGSELDHLERFESVTGPVTWKDRQPQRRLFLVGLKKSETQVLKVSEPEKE